MNPFLKMSMEELLGRVEAMPESGWEDPGGRRLSAVMAILLETPSGPGLLFTKRASELNEHAGQISFPGGALENEDSGMLCAALRETEEEIGLVAEELEVLRALPAQPVREAWMIYPYLARWPKARSLDPNPSEVDFIIAAPLARLWEEHRRGCHLVLDPDASCRYHLGDELLWGATAKITGRLLDFFVL